MEDRCLHREFVFRRVSTNQPHYLPVNLHRILQNTIQIFHVDHWKPSDLEPAYIVDAVHVVNPLSPDRLTLFSSLITLIWFVTANILVYTSVDTCRYDAPRLWWLNFAILCILYLMVLEVVVLGFVVLVVAPILFVSFSSSKLRSRLTSKTLTDLLEHIPDMHCRLEVDRRQHSSGQLHSGTTFGRYRQRNALGSSTLPAEADETTDAIQASPEFYLPHLEILL